MSTFIEILGFVLAAIGLVVTYIAAVKRSIEMGTNDAINFAEEVSELDGAKGEQKMEDAVAFLKQSMPAIFKPFVTDGMLRTAIQFTFDKVEKYAQKQIEKAANEKTEEE